jgi:flavocytochrome c
MVDSTRRYFLTATGALSAAGLASMATPSEAAPIPPRWDVEVDVIVIGTGLAGMCAAITAAEKGAKTLVLDKMARLGGTSLISGLNFACVGSALQKKQRVEDKPEWLAADMAAVSEGLGDPGLALVMARGTTRLFDFLTERGVKWDGQLKKLGGHSAARVVWPEGGGTGVLFPLYERAAKLSSFELRKQVKVDDIVLDAKGRAVGLKVRERYRFDYQAANDDLDNAAGEVRHYRARRGIVFATGGYARDSAFRAAESPALGSVATTVYAGALAGALKTMIKVGAHPIHMTLFRFAYPIPTEDLVWGAMIDPANGKRFTNEGANRLTIGDAVLERKRTNGQRTPFILYDEAGLESFHDKQRLDLSLHDLNGIDGTMLEFKSLQDVSGHHKVSLEALSATLARYNQLVTKGADTDFRKPLERSGRKVQPVAKPPYFAMPVNPRLNYTQGGARINEKAQVLRYSDGKPIPGLYCAGEATGGLHGRERLTACSMPECGVFGLIAGDNVFMEPIA